MTPPEDVPLADADAELQELVSLLLDGAMDEEQRHRLEQRLREDPKARAYCVRNLRFDALMQEAHASSSLEMEETRRVRFDPSNPASTWIAQRLQTIRWGRGADAPKSRRRGLAAWILASLLGASAVFFWWHSSTSGLWFLRNGDFEAMDITRSPHGYGTSILDWQDFFRSSNATLCEIGRTSGGKIFARSGRNVVRLADRGFLTQRLLNRREEPLVATPGTTVTVTGWSYCDGEPPFHLRASLRFVASAYPEMIQYEAVFATAPLPTGGWHPFAIRLRLPDDLSVAPSDVYLGSASSTVFRRHDHTIMANEPPPPTADLTGKDLTLSIDLDSPGVTVYLDDLGIKVSGATR